MHGFLIIPETAADETIDVLGLDLGGVPFILRQARLLRVLGAETIDIVAPPTAADRLLPALDHRLRIDRVRFLEWSSSELTNLPDGDCVFLLANAVFERGALKRLFDADAGSIVVLSTGDDAAPAMRAPGSMTQEVIESLRATGKRGSGFQDEAPIELSGRRPYHGMVSNEEERAAVEEALWEGCRKPLDGFVSRHLNRHISLAISRRIARSGITPNHVSSLTLVLGLMGAACAAQGTYLWVLVGAILLKWNSILDGVDGELARMRIETSVTGEWLDTISDDLSNQAFFLAIGYGAWQVTGESLWMILSLVTFIPLFCTSALYYRWLLKIGRGDLLAYDWFQEKPVMTGAETKKASIGARVFDFLNDLFRRDSFVALILGAAALGILKYTLFIMAPAAIGSFVALVVDMVKRARRKTAESTGIDS